MKVQFYYTGDNENIAIDEIEREVKRLQLEISDISVVESSRVCMNAYGNELTEEEFESLDPDSDEAWFDDYRFVIKAEVSSDKLTDNEIRELLEENISEFDSAFADFIEELERL